MNIKNKITQSKNNNNFDDFPLLQQTNPHVGNYSISFTSTNHRFFLDKEISSPENYRDLTQVLLTAQEHETIQLFINSPGGRLDTCVQILYAILASDANVSAIVVGECSSAASMIALACESISISPLAYMMIHEPSYGVADSAHNIKNLTEFNSKRFDTLYDEIYEGFLTPDEIQKVKDGKELWLTSEEVEERLEKRNKYFEEIAEAKEKELQEEAEKEVEVKPKRRSTKAKE